MIGIASACGHAGTLIAMLMRHRLDDVHSPQYVALGKNRALLRRASWGRPVRIVACVSLRTRRVCPQHPRPFCRHRLSPRAATCPNEKDRMLCVMTKCPDTRMHTRENRGLRARRARWYRNDEAPRTRPERGSMFSCSIPATRPPMISAVQSYAVQWKHRARPFRNPQAGHAAPLARENRHQCHPLHLHRHHHQWEIRVQ